MALFAFSQEAKANESYENLKLISSPVKRQEKALEIYFKVALEQDSVIAFKDLKSLYNVSITLNDKALECLYYGFVANQYAVLADGINPKSDSYHKKAIDMAKKYQLPAITVINLINYGYYYYNYRQMVSAYKYFLEASSLLKDLDLSTLASPGKQFKILGYYYYYIKDYKEALKYLKLGLNYPTVNKREAIDITNTIALCHFLEGNSKIALKYYNQATDLAIASKDSVWVGIIAGNIGRLLLKNKEIDSALKLIKLNRTYSIRFNEPLDAFHTMIDIAEIYANKKEWNLAEQYLNEANSYLEAKPFYLSYKMKIAQIRADVAEGRGDETLHAKFLKQYMLFKDSLQIRDNYADIERVKLFWEKDSFNKQQVLMNDKADNDESKKTGLIILSVVLFVLGLLVYRRLSLKNKHEKVVFEQHSMALHLKQQQIEKELEAAKIELQNFVDNLKQKNNIIEKMRKQFLVLKGDKLLSDIKIEEPTQLKKLLESHIMTLESWERFRGVFATVYPSFFDEILENYPLATDSELRMLALVKLELNNREISNLLGITIEGVKKAKQRLRKKMLNKFFVDSY